jgi:predicted CXXCH cytochrome family protein
VPYRRDPSKVRACSTIGTKVDCSICHEKVVGQYRESRHGTLAAQSRPDAQICRDCHSPHGTLGKLDSASQTYSRNIPSLCAKCHQTGQKAGLRYKWREEKVMTETLYSPKIKPEHLALPHGRSNGEGRATNWV